MFKIFYSWQSDLPNSTNRAFIQNALDKACKAIKSENGVTFEAAIDRDTKDVPCAPDIRDIILQKISDADAFVADVSIINKKRYKNQRPTPNPNVLTELGYALSQLGHERLILVVNTHYGGTDLLPFDVRPLRKMEYALGEDSPNREGAMKELVGDLTKAIKGAAKYGRADPVYEILYRGTCELAGLAFDFVNHLMEAVSSKSTYENVTRDELLAACKGIHPEAQSPILMDMSSMRQSNWFEFMQRLRAALGV